LNPGPVMLGCHPLSYSCYLGFPCDSWSFRVHCKTLKWRNSSLWKHFALSCQALAACSVFIRLLFWGFCTMQLNLVWRKETNSRKNDRNLNGQEDLEVPFRHSCPLSDRYPHTHSWGLGLIV
jgi:hypothetical protein